MERNVDVAIIGAGTAGIDAMMEVRKVTDNFVLINGGLLGTTCARVGCMPSKVMIQVADDFHRRLILDQEGIRGSNALHIDTGEALAHVRTLRDRFYGGIIEDIIDPLWDNFIDGYATFIEPTLLEVNDDRIRAGSVVIATGSRPVIPQKWERFQDRILTTDTIFEQTALPQDIAVIGLGAIGLELGQALKRMGFNVTGFDLLIRIGGLKDPEVNGIAVDIFKEEFPIHLGSSAEIEEDNGRINVISGDERVVVDKVLVSIGRRPNLETLNLDRLGVAMDGRGVPLFDPQTMQVGDLPIFIAGDVNNFRPILHEASHDGLVAGYNAVHDRKIAFKRKAPLTIAYSDPNICIVGASWDEVKDLNPAIGTARFRGGRIKIMLREGGMIRVYGDKENGQILGAELAAPGGEHLAHLLAWSIQSEQTVFDLLAMPFYHPCIEETLLEALEDLAGHIDHDGGPLLGFETIEQNDEP
jgi:dihydrolipoamide dehydrogenase